MGAQRPSVLREDVPEPQAGALRRELEIVDADDDAKRLHLRRGDVDLVADFRAKRVEVR